MNEFDQFVKHELKIKNYVRYTDDFIIIHENLQYLKALLAPIRKYLSEKLKIELHPQKVTLRRYLHGVDFVGYVMLPYHIRPRTKTKKRMMRKLRIRTQEFRRGEISELSLAASLRSYLGVLSHADAYHLRKVVKDTFWFWLVE